VNLQIDTARVFVPLLERARYKGLWGGRGSAKSHFFAESMVDECLATPGESAGAGLRAVCIREVQKTLKDSSKRLIEDKLKAFGLGESAGFKVFNEVIETPGAGQIIFQGMQDHTAESIKSLEGFKLAWVEEGQTMSKRSLQLLRPTIRAEDSQLWFSWNPTRQADAVDQMFRGPVLPTGAVVVKANWRDNPWFPRVLEQERLDCLRDTPDQYDHIWEGGYATVLEGAYYAKQLAEAKAAGRIGRVGLDPLMAIRVFCDIGGTGAKSDAFSMWVAQFIGREIRVLNYYEAVGQPLATHVAWLRDNLYHNAHVWLPHDGRTQDRVYDVSFESGFKAAGFKHVQSVPNQGAGAAKARIEAGRRIFPSIWFNAETTQPGLESLGWYHEKRDPQRNVGLGPEHDFSSNAADAFGLMCVVAEKAQRPKNPENERPLPSWRPLDPVMNY